MPALPPKHDPFPKPHAARERERKARIDEARRHDPLRALYRTNQWKEQSKAYLALPGNEFCWCGCGRRSNMVHHATPPRSGRSQAEREALFWDVGNWRPGHRQCNSRQAAAAEGGFGNPRRPDRYTR